MSDAAKMMGHHRVPRLGSLALDLYTAYVAVLAGRLAETFDLVALPAAPRTVQDLC